MLRFARVLPGPCAWVRCTLGPTAMASWGRSSAVAVRRGVCTCGGVRPQSWRSWLGRWMLYTWKRVSHQPVGGASPRMLLMGGVAFVWERERISNEDIVRCLRGYEERTRQFPVGGPAPLTTATPASTELGATPTNINTSTAHTVPVDTAVNNPSGDTTRPAVAKISMFDFMVAAKAELDEHSARQTARLPLVGMSRGEGRCVWTRPRLLELCRTLLWSASAEEEEEQASRLNEGTTGGPSSEEIAAQVSLSSIGASHGEPTVLATSVEMVPNEGYCDGAAVLSIDEVLGHALSASPSSAPSLSERLGVVMGGCDTADSCRLLVPLVGLNKSPSHPVYKLSFCAVEATKAAKNVVTNQLDRFALVRWGQRSLVLPLLHNHQYHLAQQLQHREPDFTAPSISHTDSILSANFLSSPKGVVTESRLLFRFFEAVRSVGQASDERFKSTALKTPPSHGSATPTTSATPITGAIPTTGATPTTGAMPFTGAMPTTGAPSRTESQESLVVGGIIGSRDSERSQGSSEPDCSCVTLAWPLAEFGAEPADGCPGSLDGWELMASEGGHQVYKKPYLDTGLFQYKVIGSYSDITSRDFLVVQQDHALRRSWDAYILQLEMVDREEASGSEVVHWVMKFPFPMASREYVYIRRSWLSPHNDSIVIVNRAVEHPRYPVVRKYVRVGQYFSEMVIKAHSHIDQVGLDFELTYFDNPQSYLPSSCVNWVTTTAMPDFLTEVHSAALEYHCQSHTPHTHTGGVHIPAPA